MVAAVAAYGAYSLGGGGTKTETGASTQSSSGTSSSSTGTTTSSASTATTGFPSGTVSISDAMALMQVPLTDASVSQSSDSITFSSTAGISIVAFAITQENATRATGMHPPSYAQGDVFVIGGLIDPTLYIPAAASVSFTVVNMDNAMYNDLVVSTVGPPFASNMSQYMTWRGYGMGMMAGSGFQGFLYMMSVLSPANYAGGWAFTYAYNVTIPSYANLWYVCTYPGHGMGGMYGEIVTTGTTSSTTTSSTSTTKTGVTSISTTSVVSSSALSSTYTTSTSTGLAPGTMSISAAEALLKTPPVGSTVSRSADSITFTSYNISITAFAIMPDNATNLTGMQPPTYAKDDVFVIGGLIDPTLYVPKGATVHMTVVNLDDDMYHDLVVTTLSPPYPYMMMQGMMWGGDFLYMMPVLSPANYAASWAPYYSYTVTIPSAANLWYICTYPGHAESGMYGEIVTT